ncbi:AI-2E family transporter [Micromonospora costi]|uniref:AI-2E family transporter n=1 Tax=Micromonospora costi TaxID=1530042 RepID=UPI0034061B5A
MDEDGTGRSPGRAVPNGGANSLRHAWAALPWLVRSAVLWSACLVVIVAGLYVLARITGVLAPVAIAVAVALFLAALLDPVLRLLRRWRLPPSLAALLSILLLVGVLAGVLVLAWNLTAGQFGALRHELTRGLANTRELVTAVLPVNDQQIDRVVGEVRKSLGRSRFDLVAGARTLTEAFGAALLSLVLLFFLLKDGRWMWGWVLTRMTGPNREVVAEAGRAGWRTLGAYSRGTLMIAASDALGIGLALVLLRVPLALPLVLITFIGAFIPIIGATVAGIVAVLVALAAKGPVTALLLLAAVIAVQQIEGNVLDPLIMKRQVRLHPAVLLVVVAAGTFVAGIAGAFVSVPLAAVTWRVVDTVQRDRRRTDPTGPSG